ncbi:MAG TPA: hypothetical protein VE134_01750 [Methanomicrobiales archaeon]|nr:hypothetical protein [Methanomicrobiales archaeon]
MRTAGFLINPIAGMGGAVGLKGTDGQLDEARARGATPESGRRAVQALLGLRDADILFLTCSGAMGEDALITAGIHHYTVVYDPSLQTSAEDTRAACCRFLSEGADLILFCGGTGRLGTSSIRWGGRFPSWESRRA